MYKSEMATTNQYNVVDMARTEKELTAIRVQGERREFVDGSGRLIVKVGNRTTRYA